MREEWCLSYGDCESFIGDGPIDPERWFNKGDRILCLLKEPHGGDHWDLAVNIREHGGLKQRHPSRASREDYGPLIEEIKRIKMAGALSQKH